MKIKDKFITAMDQLKAMQGDDNWNNEKMLDAAVQLVNLDSHLQSSEKVTVTVRMLGDCIKTYCTGKVQIQICYQDV